MSEVWGKTTKKHSFSVSRAPWSPGHAQSSGVSDTWNDFIRQWTHLSLHVESPLVAQSRCAVRL